jgi:hemerythrin superfamily protein
MTTTAEDTNLIKVITDDHRAVEKIFDELQSRQGSPEHRRALADHVIAELVRHSVAEEQHMYPAAREVLLDGDKVADHEISEHAEAEQIMKNLDGLSAEDPQFDQLLDELIQAIYHHVQEEEKNLLPRLEAACSPERLQELGAQVLKAKKIAPTRPHPAAPDRPPANRILGPGVGLIDRIRDALTGRDV